MRVLERGAVIGDYNDAVRARVKVHLRRFLKHVWWVALSVGGLFVFRGVVPEAPLRAASEVSGNFLQTFGGIYGVIVAFVIYVVWQQHNETQVAVEREAVALAEVYTTLGWLTAWPQRDEVRARLRRYAKVVPALNGALPERVEEDDKRLLDGAFHDFLGYVPTAAEERFFDPALQLFHELNEAREHRLTVSRLRLPEALRWFVFLGGSVSVGAVWMLWVESFVVQAALTGAMTWVIVAATSLILDLDDPYGGDFVVNWARFNEAGARMDGHVCPALDPKP